MSLKRVGVLLGRGIIQGPKGFLFIMAIVAPIILSLVVSLVFGTLFNDTPRMGIVDEGDSRLLAIANEYHSVITVEYDTDAELRQAVESGAVDIGMVLPPDFDNAVTQGLEADVTAYIWGEGQIEDFAILEINVFSMLQQLAGREAPVNIETITLGEGAGVPWNDRLLPFIVLTVVTEKERKTLTALAATPATLGEIFISKGVIGAVLSLFMGVVILVINHAFGLHPLLAGNGTGAWCSDGNHRGPTGRSASQRYQQSVSVHQSHRYSALCTGSGLHVSPDSRVGRQDIPDLLYHRADCRAGAAWRRLAQHRRECLRFGRAYSPPCCYSFLSVAEEDRAAAGTLTPWKRLQKQQADGKINRNGWQIAY